MYERFTDRARKVMQLANQEAQRFNHEYIGTEYILLGIVKEGTGQAAVVLNSLEVDLRKIRMEVEKIVQSGPDMVTMGKRPQTPRAKKVIEYAFEEARNLNHKHIGTEHLLLGLLREQDGVAAQVLMNLGAKLDDVRKQILELVRVEVPPGKMLYDRIKVMSFRPPMFIEFGSTLVAVDQIASMCELGTTEGPMTLVSLKTGETHNCQIQYPEALQKLKAACNNPARTT